MKRFNDEETPQQDLPQTKSCLDHAYRWIVLFFIMWLTFGTHPARIHPELINAT
jgi:hypothetical protein